METWPVRINLGFRVQCRGSAWMGSSAFLLMPLRTPTITASSEQIVKWPCPHTFPTFGLSHHHRGVVTRQASGREGIPGWACAPIQKVRRSGPAALWAAAKRPFRHVGISGPACFELSDWRRGGVQRVEGGQHSDALSPSRVRAGKEK